MLTRDAMASASARWGAAWNDHNLDGLMDLSHDEIYFESWTGASVRGKEDLRETWAPWFANHGDFRFHDRGDLHRRSRTEDARPLAAGLALAEIDE